MYSNKGLVEHFVDGGTSGKCNRMAIEEGDDGWTYLWGYGHALYAARKAGGPLFIYNGWYGYSSTTSKHLNALKSAAKSAYGEPRNDGDTVRAKVDGDGGMALQQRPPKGRALIVVESGQPGTSYGKLKAPDRAELSHVHDRHLSAPDGAGG